MTVEPSRKLLDTFISLLRSAFIILAFLLIGKWITYLIAWSIPGSVIGLILLFIALSVRVIPLSWVKPTGDLLLGYMTLFFVPVGVALLNYSDLLSQYWLAILLSSIVSTMVVLLIVGLCYQKLIKDSSHD
ncbi:CidA/LrgA family protein [Psychrobium sp. MM17-31]|uniref:CidA/LrgA family protein n=1 Tax=Psychrobium sp. MM17-31 TaxID=2917758 RepID=UPI001EF6D29A|nr:CidA/LrgA family protein [Psychrobium sp. MM17-31]MCG7531131.1 CidA/LrgA family protein [Psychrobium sp. MM17-31]